MKDQTWEAFAKVLYRGGNLAFADFIVLLPLRSRFEPLPRKRSFIEVHEYVPKGLDIVSSTLFSKIQVIKE